MKNPIALRIIIVSIFILFTLLLPIKIYATQLTAGIWTYVGLSNYTIHSFAVDLNNPNILYAGTVSYGIFKSTDGGTTWNAINNGILNLAGYFTDIVVDPSNSNIVYAGGVGVGSGNPGIFKSTNGGATWTLANNGITNVGLGGPPADVQSMIIDPNTNVLYVGIASNCGSVYKSTNAAASWTRGVGLPCDPTVVRRDPFNSNLLYTRSNQGINNSIDGGINWTNISNYGNYGVFYALAIDPFNSNNLYANDNTGVYKSTDGGINWVISSGGLNNVYKALISDPVRPNTVYAGEDLGIETSAYMTVDGGSTWTDITNGLPNNVGVKRLLVPVNDSNVLYAATEKGIYIYGLANNQSLDLSVPLLKQTSSQWGSQIYDSANLWSPSNPTINSWGCALTSAAMVFRYYGLNKLPDETSLDPGTLNTWLKNQNDGYIGNGLVNWLALARLSKLAKSTNGISLFDALEYTRIATSDDTVLTADINNKIPDILEEPGHFIVAKGINGQTFNINDPFYDRTTLNDGYLNTFLSLGKYSPSNTDLSYIMLVTDPNINISLKDLNNNLQGEQFIQSPLVNDTDASQKSGPPIKIFYFKKPINGTYQVILTSANTQAYDIKTYLYDKDGQVKIANQTGLISPDSPETLTVKFDNQNSNNSMSEKNVKFQTLIDDIKKAKSLSLINGALADGLISLTKDAQRNYNRRLKKVSLMELSTLEKILNSTRGKLYGALLSDKAYDVLLYDIGYLKNHL
ncbi:MAG: C39 family peptidase [Patescibacteria group bacterium]|nr:C39 family peptidase [Patescibacteria group bacterium]